LRNALKQFEFNSRNELSELLGKRAEQLKVEDFIYLTQNVIPNSNK